MKHTGGRLAAGLVLLAVLGLTLSCQSGPQRDWLVYSGPVEVSVDAGDSIPGTGLRYLGRTEQGAEMLIGDQKAICKVGDSLDYKGEPAQGVRLNLALRVAWYDAERLHAVGTVELAVRDPQPQPMPVAGASPLHHTVPILYWVERGRAIPGTTITYQGKTDQGALLGGMEGYPYRKTADSILWEGRLRDGVWLRLEGRTGFFDDDRLQVLGLATVWVDLK
ncbi:MAG: hypothetical protein ACP5UM_02860 [Anaerolineae bacterium]